MFCPRIRKVSYGFSGKVNPLAGALVLLAGAILVIGAILLFRGRGFGGLEPLPTLEYQSSPNNFLGNRYLLTGQIHSLLLWDQGVGRLVAVKPEGVPSRVAVFVPDSLAVSLHTGQRYHMDVAVQEGGLLYVLALEKY